MNNIYNLPSGKPLGTDIKKNVGNALTGPNPQPAPKTAKEAREQAYARLNKFAIQAPKQDVLKYDKPFTFNSDVNGSNFERYYAHPKFKQLGFSPFRDNETVYNQNSSLWDDVTRARKQWLPLAGLAVSGTFGNWDDLLSGKPDVDNAIEMERYMNIGSSSREGFGAKALNFGVNSAYTAGVIGSILAEEAVFAGAALTGVGTGVAAAGTAKNTLRLGKAFDRLADVFRTGSDINQARKTWDTVGKVSRAVLPFQNTADLFRTAERTKMGWDKMDDFAKAYNSFGAFYRDLREINLVTSEAKLEGGFVQNEVANDLIKQFREKEGRDPNDAESAKIYQQALKAGFSTSYANMAGIYASNKVVLNKLLKGIPVVGQLEHAASKSVRGSIVKNADWLKTGKNPYEVLYGLKKFGNAQWLAQTAKNAPKAGLRYMTANLMEGTQEVYQEATAEAMKKYYIDTFNDPSRAHQGYMMESIKHGLKSQMSGQGLEVFLSGALMAGPIQVAGLAMTKTGQYANMLNLKRQEKAFASNTENAGKENPYTKKLNEFKEWDSKVVNALNDVTKNKKDYFSKLYRNTKEQKDLGDLFEDAVLNNDTKTAIDSKDDSLFTHIKTLRKSGTLDLFKEELQSLSQLSDKELAEAFNEKDGANPVDSKTIGERINTVLGRIDEIDNHLSDVEKLTNIYDPKTDFFKWFAFEEARELVAYNDYSYKRTGDRMLSIQEDIKKAMSAVKLDPLYADIAPLFNVGRGGSIIMGATENYGMESEIELLTKEIENLQGTTEPDLVRRRNELTAKKKSLSELSVAVQNVVTANKLLKNTNATQEEQDEAAERVKTAEELLYDAFKKHLQNLSSKGAAGVSSGLFDSTIDTLFAKYKDYWRLSSDQAYLANAINTLYNPEVFGQAVDRLSEAAAEADRVKAEQAKKMAVEFEKRYATNDFLNDLLSKFNVFVSEEEAEAYLANNIVPSKFINADTGYEIDPRANADKFNEILDLIDQYDEIFFERTGERLFKPAFGDIGARVAGTITQTGVEVNELIPEFNPNDKRTLADIAEEFGFDKGRAESSVRIDTILNAIIASTYATPAQKELARKLITLTDKAELINFRQNHHINSSYDKTNGVVVDARYSSKDYGAKASVPIEYSILNALMQKVITDSLQDTEFANRITELRQLASASTNNTTKLLYKYALVSNEQFVAELLTNGDFQEYLATVDYSGDQTELTQEAASIWSKFLDILKDILQKLLGFNTSLYREAMAVTLNKLSQPRTQGPQTQPTPGPQTPAGGAAPTADTQDQELMRKLRDKYDAIISGMSPEEAARMSFDSWRTTDSAAIAIIRKHNADKIRAQAAAGTGAGSTTTVTIAAKRNALTASGRTHGEINAMTEEEFEEAYNNIGKDGFVPNLNNEDWGEVDTNMQIARDRAAALRLGLTEDKKKYIQYDENGNPIPGTERERISDAVKEAKVDSNPEATSRGNLIDVLFKDFLMGKLQSSDEFKQRYKELQPQDGYNATNFSDEMLEDLFDIVRTVQRNLVKSGIKVIPDFPKIAAQIGSKLVAGEMDLVGYKKNGEVVIIDIKTSVANRRLGYVVDTALRNALGDKYGELITAMKGNNNVIQKAAAAMKDPADTALVLQTVGEAIKFYPEFEDFQNGTNIVIPLYYPVSDRRQQLSYKEALRQTTGLVADKIYAFPVTVDAFKNGKHERAQLIGPFISEGTTSNAYAIPIDTSRSVYELGIKDMMTQTFDAYPTNPLAQKAPQQPAPTTPISELDRLNAEVMRLVNIRGNDKVVRQAIIDSNNGRITLEELDAITKKWDDENGLTAAMEAYDAEKKKQSTPVSDLEIEKQKITPAEFKEVVRLAKFFLENPSEPGVKGDARSRYPELFKAITDIERTNTFTKDSLKEISDGTGLAKKGTEILNPDKVVSQLKVGDKITFYAEKERTGVWDGKTIREDKSNSPFGILGILSDVNGYIKNQSKIDAELDALEGKQTQPNIVKVYHHTTVAPENFDFGNFQRGKDQISQFGDGLNAATTTNSFFVSRYGNPIEGEIDDSDFVVIDANKSEKELYEELKSKGYKFNNPATGSYVGNDPAKEYDSNEKANEQPAIIFLFNDFQQSNPQVKGVKVLNHIIGDQTVAPFYVIYDAKSFYGPGSLSKTSTAQTQPAGTTSTSRESAIQAAEELIKTAPSKAKNIRKDIEMMRVSDGFIGSKAPETKDTYVSATEAYQRGWGTAANPSDFTGMTAVMISGSGTWNPKQSGGKINNEDINRHFELFYKPLINKAIQQGVTTFNIGNAAGMDKVVSDYLESNGFQKTTKGEWNEFKKEKIVNPTRTYDNKPIAKGLKGKVIYITPDSYTTGDMSKHSEDLVIGNELVDEVILGLDQEALKVKLESLSQGTSKLSKAAAGLLYFLKNTGISENTLSGKDNFKYLLAVLERNGNTTISAEIYTKALTEARKLANEGKTVIFDNIGVLKFGTDIDLAILNAESDIAKKADTTTTGKTAIADAENDFQGPKKRVFIGNAETIITGGAVTRIPKALKDLRVLINGVNNKVDFATTKDYLTTLQSMGILEELLEDQNITKETFQALLNQKQAQVATQLSISDLVSNEQVLVKFLNKKGEERIGLVVGETTDNMLEIKDITDEYKKLNEGNLFVDVDDLGYSGLGTKAKSLKLAERDVNERVLSIIKSEKVDKPEPVTKAQSNTTQSNADAERKAQEDNLMDWDPTDKNARDKNNKDFLSCGDL